MNSAHAVSRERPSRFPGLVLAVIVAATASAKAPVPAKPAATPPAPDKTKPYSLFMGADFDLEQNKKFYRVQDVEGSAFIVNVDQKRTAVPMDRGSVNLKVQMELKLAPVTVTIGELATERAYTPETDPNKKFLRQQRASEAQQASENASYKVKVTGRNLSNALRAMNDPYAGASQQAFNQAELDRAQNAFDSAQSAMVATQTLGNSDLYNAGFHAATLAEELAAELFDAIHVSFVVSSPRQLSNPYLVIVAEFHLPDEKPGVSHSWIYATEMDSITDQPRRVVIKRGGLPAGFILGKCQLHLYNRGREVGTTASENQVALDRQEAFDFIVINHLGNNKGATLPAKPVMGRLTAELRTKLSEDQLRQQYFVEVSQDGMPGAAFLDEGREQKVADSNLEAVIGNLRFTPALDKGKAIAALAKFKFDELASNME